VPLFQKFPFDASEARLLTSQVETYARLHHLPTQLQTYGLDEVSLDGFETRLRKGSVAFVGSVDKRTNQERPPRVAFVGTKKARVVPRTPPPSSSPPRGFPPEPTRASHLSGSPPDATGPTSGSPRGVGVDPVPGTTPAATTSEARPNGPPETGSDIGTPLRETPEIASVPSADRGAEPMTDKDGPQQEALRASGPVAAATIQATNNVPNAAPKPEVPTVVPKPMDMAKPPSKRIIQVTPTNDVAPDTQPDRAGKPETKPVEPVKAKTPRQGAALEQIETLKVIKGVAVKAAKK